MAAPASYGVGFTKKLHRRAEGLTDPSNIKLPSQFYVLVTGAGKGIGIHLALAYAKAGASGIVISSRTKSDLDDLTQKIAEINKDVKVLAMVADTTNDDHLSAIVAATTSTFGHLDVVIANAGIISRYLDPGTPAQRLPSGIIEDGGWEDVFNINLSGVYKTARFFMPLLIAAPPSSPKAFIGMTSIACHTTDSSFVPIAYSVSKIAVNRFVEILANDHGVGKEGILAFAMHPGGVVTAQTEGHPGEGWQKGKCPFP